jgi:hypothetical protein
MAVILMNPQADLGNASGARQTWIPIETQHFLDVFISTQ